MSVPEQLTRLPQYRLKHSILTRVFLTEYIAQSITIHRSIYHVFSTLSLHQTSGSYLQATSCYMASIESFEGANCLTPNH